MKIREKDLVCEKTILAKLIHLREPTGSIVVIWVNIFQTELMVEIYSKNLIRAIGKV